MVGIVIVCHSNKLAEGILHEARMFAKNCPIAIAGGDDNDDYGTSYEKIKKAIADVYSDDGVCILADVGSSIMTIQMIIEESNDDRIKLIDCPLIEGTIAAAVSSELNDNMDMLIKKVLSTKNENKM